MKIHYDKCTKCDALHDDFFSACPRCDKEGHRAEVLELRGECIRADHTSRVLHMDPWGSALIVDDRDHYTVVSGLREALHLGPDMSFEKCVSDAMRLRDENRELLIENATLRRALEKKR